MAGTLKEKVVFRKWKHNPQKSEVIALLIDTYYFNELTPNCIMSYMHVGQHSEADYPTCMKSTVPATPREYASLKREMKQMGYRLAVVKYKPRKR